MTTKFNNDIYTTVTAVVENGLRGHGPGQNTNYLINVAHWGQFSTLGGCTLGATGVYGAVVILAK